MQDLHYKFTFILKKIKPYQNAKSRPEATFDPWSKHCQLIWLSQYLEEHDHKATPYCPLKHAKPVRHILTGKQNLQVISGSPCYGQQNEEKMDSFPQLFHQVNKSK